MAWLGAIKVSMEAFLFIFKSLAKTDDEKRREALVEYAQAKEKRKQGDTEDMEKWLGERV